MVSDPGFIQQHRQPPFWMQLRRALSQSVPARQELEPRIVHEPGESLQAIADLGGSGQRAGRALSVQRRRITRARTLRASTRRWDLRQEGTRVVTKEKNCCCDMGCFLQVLVGDLNLLEISSPSSLG
jgi:hypothetical protein